MHNELTIISTGRCLPEYCLTNRDIEQYMDTTSDWIASRTGIEKRYICKDESCTSLAVNAAKAAIEKAEKNCSGFSREKIGLVIAATSSSDRMFPSTACFAAKEAGLKQEVLAFDITAACSGFIYGLGTAYSVISSGFCEYALVIGSEKLSRFLDLSDRSTGMLFGDGAGAAVVRLTQSEGCGFTFKAWADANEEALSCRGLNDGYTPLDANAAEPKLNFLKMNGPDVFRFAVRAVPQAIDEVLKKAGIGLDSIDYVVCHQANARILESVKKKYPGYESKFYMNIADYGNTSSASIPIALDEMCEKGMLKEGCRVLCVGFGGGLTWGSAIVNF